MIHHEFWPTSLLHLPVFIYALGQSLRFRSCNYFVWANPKIKTGGWVGYSRNDLFSHLPEKYLPQSILISPKLSKEEVVRLWEESTPGGLYPVVVKPNLGGNKGRGVKYISTPEELLKYHPKALQEYIIQEYIDEPEEFGVFVLRTPDGFQISSVVQKDFLILHGDGRSTLKELWQKHSRARQFIREHDLPMYSERVLEVGQTIWLQPLASRSKGTRYVNANSIIDDMLTGHFEVLTKSIPQFFYGRIEVRAPSVNALGEGRFKVFDISGVGAEPGHIYDSNYKWTQAIKDLLWHWKMLSVIVSHNRKKKFAKESAWTTFKTVFQYRFKGNDL